MCRHHCHVSNLPNGLGTRSNYCPGIASVELAILPHTDCVWKWTYFSQVFVNLLCFCFCLQTDKSPSQYRGIFHALRTVFVEEGPRALYKGWLPSVIGVVSDGFDLTCYSFKFRGTWFLFQPKIILLLIILLLMCPSHFECLLMDYFLQNLGHENSLSPSFTKLNRILPFYGYGTL